MTMSTVFMIILASAALAISFTAFVTSRNVTYLRYFALVVVLMAAPWLIRTLDVAWMTPTRALLFQLALGTVSTLCILLSLKGFIFDRQRRIQTLKHIERRLDKEIGRRNDEILERNSRDGVK